MYRILGPASLYIIILSSFGDAQLFVNHTTDTSTDININNETFWPPAPLLSISPPTYYIGYEGETTQHDCRPAVNISETYWIIPHNVPIVLRVGENKSGVYIFPNNTLLIQYMKMEFRGFYKCVVNQGNRHQAVGMNLHVVKPIVFDYGFRAVVGVVAAVVVVLIMVVCLVGHRFCGKTKGSEKHDMTDCVNTEEQMGLRQIGLDEKCN